jgi:hypothetical protein
VIPARPGRASRDDPVIARLDRAIQKGSQPGDPVDAPIKPGPDADGRQRALARGRERVAGMTIIGRQADEGGKVRLVMVGS